jgi:putative ABC transport system permease protein
MVRLTERFTEGVRQDLRDALRGLRRSRGFAATVVVTLALGSGANAAMFNLVDRLMFRPLAYLTDPDTVHRIYWQWHQRGSTTTTVSTQYARYLDLQKGTSSFAKFAAFFELQQAIGDGESAREQRVGAVSASYFDFFAAKPVLGRFFRGDEDVIPRGADVAVLSYAFWRSAFGGRDVLGELLRVGNVHAAIIGVAPEGFGGVNDADPPAVYIPVTTYAGRAGTGDSNTYFNRYHWGWVNVLVRRRAGVTLQHAEADATMAFRATWEIARADNPDSPSLAEAQPRVWVSSVRPGAGPNPTLEARTAFWLWMVAAIVLVIACANVANLFLARALQRTRETAVRRALGVSQWRLMTLPLTESLLLALGSSAAAVLIAHWASAALATMLMPSAAAPPPSLVDARTLAFTFATTLVAGAVVGLTPLYVGRVDLAHALRSGSRGNAAEGQRLRRLLLVVQAALSIVLLIGAVLFVRSLDAVVASPVGYDADRVLLVQRVIRGPMFDDATQRAVRALLLTTARGLPGVESAAWVSSAPFASTSSTNLYVDGVPAVNSLGAFSFQATTPDYFRTMGTRILRGRGLTAADREGTPPVAVVSESMARVLWPKQNPLGQCFRMREAAAPCTTVVGVAEDIVQRDMTDHRRYHYYLSIDQYTRTWGNGLLLRLSGDPRREGDAVRAALQRAMPATAYLRVQPVADLVQNAQRSWRLGAAVFVAFGALTLVVAAVGLYGSTRYDIAQRRHELGIRVALGAGRGDVLRLVVGQSVAVALLGTCLGVPVAWAAARWIQPLLFQQSAVDPLVYAGVSLAIVGVALAATMLPAIRAANADPNVALRGE